MKRARLISLMLLVVSICAGCTAFVKEPRISIDSTNIVGIDTSGVDFELFVAVDNPNSFDLALQGYTFDLQLMTLPFSSGGSRMKFVFPARQQSYMRLPLRVKYADLIEVIKRRPDLDKIPYQVDAGLNLDTPLGELLIPVKKTDVISIPESYRPNAYFMRFLKPLKELL